MRTIKIYEYKELTDVAQMAAVSNLKKEFEKWYRENDLFDIFKTKAKYERIFDVDVIVKKDEESNSYDWFDYKDKTKSNEDNYFDTFCKKNRESLNCKRDTWSDDVFADVLKEYRWDLYKSYGYNVSKLFSAFINRAIDVSEDNLKDTDYTDVENYIYENRIEFYEDGKRYIE